MPQYVITEIVPRETNGVEAGEVGEGARNKITRSPYKEFTNIEEAIEKAAGGDQVLSVTRKGEKGACIRMYRSYRLIVKV